MDKEMQLIIGRNAIQEALNSNRAIDSLLVAKGDRNFGALVAGCKQKGIPVKEVAVEKLNSLVKGNHQGVVAMAAAHAYVHIEDIFALAQKRQEDPFIILADELEDPHNLGAVIRTAACGAHGVVLPKRRSAGLTYAVEKASAGALEYMPVARVSNLAAAIDDLKEKGLWIYGAHMEGQNWCDTSLTGPIGLVIGSEGRGISRLIKEKCDGLLSLPMQGHINSLNASVAAGILMYEILRQRRSR